MSQQRFIRCPHCGLPHEGGATRCPTTNKPIIAKASRRRVAPPPSEENYAWAHSIHPPKPHQLGGLDPTNLEGFAGHVIEGKYLIEKLIGRGGMGAVFRARNLRIDKPVAIKVLYANPAKSSNAAKRFRREARIIGRLGHPNIIQMFDLGQLADGKPYQVLELLRGRTLSDRLRIEGGLREDALADIAEQVLSALAAAHENGVIHRDLKPENIFLLERHGEVHVKLLDFGVSKMITEQTLSLTRTGAIVGTPYYLAPEQAMGKRTLDHRVDIWAMGVWMYEALTGVLPFNGKSYDKLVTNILRCRPVPPSRFQPRLSDEIEGLILRALSRSPDQRFQTSSEMLRALRATRLAHVQRAQPSEERHVPSTADRTQRTQVPVRPDDEAIELEDPTEITDELMIRRDYDTSVQVDEPKFFNE